MHLIAWLEQLSFPLKSLLVALLILAIALCDFVTGPELSFSLFYILPVWLATWLLNRTAGILASLASAAMWFAADVAAGHQYAHALIGVWNAFVRLAIFLIIAWLFADLRAAFARESAQARIDQLTGAANSRHFLEALRDEIQRLKRYGRSFSLVYLDLDNFKQVNDRFGHIQGDALLRIVVDYASTHLRPNDLIARLGGDEFALLLPETPADAAKAKVSALQAGLVAEMQARHWPVTFSAGVVSCTDTAPTADELVRIADELMYEVKRAGKNAIRCTSFSP